MELQSIDATGGALTGAAARVAQTLLSGGPQTAAALAQTLCLTPTAIRRHLDALTRDGHVLASERAPYGPNAREVRRGRGRPAKVFAITASGRDALESFHRQGGSYQGIARDALAFVAEHSGPQALAEFAHKRASSMLQSYRDRMGAHPDIVEDVRAMASALSDDGFAASITHVGPGGVQLCQHNCPVAHVAEEFPVLCEAETKAFSELLGVNVTRLATIAKGAGVCTTHIPVPTGTSQVARGTTTTAVQEDRS